MQQKIKELNAFWDRLHQFDSTQIEDAMRFAMAYLSEQIGSGNVMWVGSVQFPNDKPESMWGWRTKSAFFLYDDTSMQAMHEERLECADKHQAKEAQIEVARHAGTFRTFCFSHDMPPAWLQTDEYKQIVAIGTHDVLFSMQPTSKNSESGLIFIKRDPGFFSQKQIDYIALATAPLLYLHKAMMLYKGIGIAENALTNSEARVLKHLLKEKSESEIAKATNLSPHTVHTYATRIYRKYGVSGRQGLMALWLSF